MRHHRRVTDSDIRQERAALCDLLEQLGPQAPTLCGGWRTRDLAAHLVLRERRPLAAGGIVLPPLAGLTSRVQQRLAAQPYSTLVNAVRRPPAWSPVQLGRLDRAVNTLELFVHHEDVRRAQPGWQPRELPRRQAAALWRRVRALGRLRLRRFPARLRVTADSFGELCTGRGAEQVSLAGAPGELAMFLTGRQHASLANVTGPEALVARLNRARLGL